MYRCSVHVPVFCLSLVPISETTIIITEVCMEAALLVTYPILPCLFSDNQKQHGGCTKL
jgi:hypothetical protein